MNTKKIFIITIVCAAFIFSAVFGVFFFIRELNTVKLPVLGQVKPFVLTDTEEKQFFSQKLRGKVWIADFIFTSCGDVCPMMSKNMAGLSRTFEAVPAVQLVSISVNPEVDTPQKLKEYKSQFKKVGDNWHLLTGNREDIKDIVLNSFKLGKVDEPIFHSSYFALIDRSGYIRGYYDGKTDEDIKVLFKEASGLLKERF